MGRGQRPAASPAPHGGPARADAHAVARPGPGRLMLPRRNRPDASDSDATGHDDSKSPAASDTAASDTASRPTSSAASPPQDQPKRDRGPRHDRTILHRSADLRRGAVHRHYPDRRHRAVCRCRSRSTRRSRRRPCQVSISYPGASAQVVADTVAAPIEQQVNGVEGMLYMSSQMGNDGSYTLTVTFDIGTDLNTALVMVQNRVTLAMPQLPTAVQNQGITIRKKTPDILMIVNFYLARRPLRRHLPEQFRHHLRQGRAAARRRRLGHQLPGRARLQHPRLARSAEAGVAEHDRHRRGQRRSAAEPRCPRRPGRPAARLPGPVIAIADRHAGPAHRRRSNSATSSSRSIQQRHRNVKSIGRLRERHGSAQARPARLGLVFGRLRRRRAPRRAEVRCRSTPSGRPRPSMRRQASISPPTIGPTMRLGAVGWPRRTTGTATSTAAIHDHRPHDRLSSRHPGTALDSRAEARPAAEPRAGGGGTTGGGATTTVGDDIRLARPAVEELPRPRTASGSAAPEHDVVRLLGGLRRAPPSPSDAVVRLRDVARVELGAQNYNQCLHLRRPPRPSALAIYQLPGTNALDVADRVQAKMEELKTRFPDGVDYSIAYDTTPFIRESVDDVVHDAARSRGAGRRSWCWSSCRTGGP